MDLAESSATLCRICLQNGATLPIFENVNDENCIRSKLSKVFKEKIENIEGYPTNICSLCNKRLNTLYEFVNTYEISCKILNESYGKVKIENVEKDNNNDVWDADEFIEIKIEYPEKEVNVNPSELLEKLKPIPGLQITKVESINVEDDDDLPLQSIKEQNQSLQGKKLKQNGKLRSSKTRQAKSKIKNRTLKKTQTKSVKNQTLKELIEKPPKKPLKRVPEETTVLCHHCGSIFEHREKLRSHIEVHHSTTRFTCMQCPKEFKTKRHLNVHISYVHAEKTIKCEKCTRMFSCKKRLTDHVKTFHDKKRKDYKCKHCERSFRSAISTLIHERSLHTGERPAECKECGKCFFHDLYLKEHMRLHTGELPFKCPICERGYTQRANMKSHLRIHKISELTDTIMTKMRPNLLKFLKPC